MSSRSLQADWFRWSDGREITGQQREGFARLMRKRYLRATGETAKERFSRFRACIEAAERLRANRAG